MIYSKGLIFTFLVILFYPICYGHTKVTDSKLGSFYSISNGKGTTLTVSPSNKTIILQKREGTLIFRQNQHITTYSLSSTKNGKQYTVSLSTDLSRNLTTTNFNIDKIPTQYNTRCFSESQIKRLNEEVQKLIRFSKNNDSSYVSKIIDDSCEKYLLPQRIAYLEDEIANHFSENSNLHKCLSSPKLKESLGKSSEVFEDLMKAVNGYVNDLSLTTANKSPDFKIRCESYKEEQKHNAKYENGEISIAVINGKLPRTECQDFDSILTHEYLHKVGVKEKNIKAIERFCLEVTNPEVLKNPKCAVQFAEMTSQSRVIQEVDHKAEKVIKAEQAKLTPIVQKELEKAPLKEVKVSDATWSSLANDPNATIPTAERNSIAATMNSNFESMSGSLNRALGATQTPALAANESPASSSSGSSSASSESTSSASRSPASSYERAERETYSSDNSKNSRGSRGSKESTGPSNEFHTVEEYIVDSKNAKDPRSFNIPGARQGASADRGQDQSVAATTRQGMSATASTGENPAEGSQVTNAGRARNSEIARSASGGDFAGGDVSSGGTSSLPAQGSGPAPARGSNRRQPASQGGGSSSNAFNGGNSVSSLKEQTLIRGSDYESITSNYRRRDFSNELHQQGVSIYIEKQGMSLGRSDAKIKFIDNGEYLRRAEGN